MQAADLRWKDGVHHALRAWVGYAVTVLIAIALLLLIHALGADLAAPAPEADQRAFDPLASGVHGAGALVRVLLALAIVIGAARLMGLLFHRLGQPAVIGEVIAGLMLGPSVLGYFWPDASVYVMPQTIAPILGTIAQIGVVLFMFLVGVELNPAYMRRSSSAVLAVSHSSIVVPFLLGAALSLFLYPRYSTLDVPFSVFTLFMGIAMSVTAFPVLARILTDRGLHRSRLGSIALTCAAVDDVTAWCLLALVISVAQADIGSFARTLAYTLVFIAFMLFAVRYAVRQIARREEASDSLRQGTMAVLLVLLLLSATAAEYIGIHALFGAFLLGVVVPHDSILARRLIDRLQDFAVIFFLPIYFSYTGMRTQIGTVDGLSDWLVCGLIIAVASLGKLGGGMFAARLSGLRWRESAALGVLMNTRGLMQLIVLNIGLDMGVLSPPLFAMLVIMAIVTTVATTPLLDLLNRDRSIFSQAASAPDVGCSESPDAAPR